MPTVPTVTGRQVESRGVSAPALQVFAQPNIGDVFAQVAPQYAGALIEAKQRADVAMAQEGTLRLDYVDNQLKTDFMTLQGKNAIGKAPQYIQQFDDQINTIAAGINSERSRNTFLLNAQQQRTQFATQLERHEFSQRQQFEEG